MNPAQKQTIEQTPVEYVIGSTPESTLIVDLSQAVTSDTPDSSCPDELTFVLSDESAALGLNEILELSSDG